MPESSKEQPRDFAAVLFEIGGGRLHALMSDQLAEVTRAVQETGKKGVLTLKIELKPSRKFGTNALEVTGTSLAKAPVSDEDSPMSIFFAEDGELTRSDPKQPTLPFREESSR